MKFDKAYFLKKFAAIPDHLWRMDGVYGRSTDVTHCALGHCGWYDAETCTSPEEGRALYKLFRSHPSDPSITGVNDGFNPNFPQETPKARILAALNELPD